MAGEDAAAAAGHGVFDSTSSSFASLVGLVGFRAAACWCDDGEAASPIRRGSWVLGCQGLEGAHRSHRHTTQKASAAHTSRSIESRHVLIEKHGIQLGCARRTGLDSRVSYPVGPRYLKEEAQRMSERCTSFVVSVRPSAHHFLPLAPPLRSAFRSPHRTLSTNQNRNRSNRDPTPSQSPSSSLPFHMAFGPGSAKRTRRRTPSRHPL